MMLLRWISNQMLIEHVLYTRPSSSNTINKIDKILLSRSLPSSGEKELINNILCNVNRWQRLNKNKKDLRESVLVEVWWSGKHSAGCCDFAGFVVGELPSAWLAHHCHLEVPCRVVGLGPTYIFFWFGVVRNLTSPRKWQSENKVEEPYES